MIYDPVKDEMFYAENGQGPYLNDRRLRVSGRRDPAQCLIATGIPFLGREGHEKFLEEAERVMARTAGLRRWGVASLDLAYVAAGRVDGFWERGLSPWDIAAGVIIAREAGALVSQVDRREIRPDSPSILAANPEISDRLATILAGRE